MQSTKKAAKEKGSRRSDEAAGLDDELRLWIDEVIVPAMLMEFLNENRAERK